MSKTCKKCGWINSDSDTICQNPMCNEPLPAGGNPKPKNLGKLLAFGAAGLAVVVAVFFVVTNLFGTSALGAAAQNSVSSLVDELRSQSNLSAYLDNMEVLDEKSDFTFVFGVKNQDSIFGGTVNYAGSQKLAAGTLTYQDVFEGTQLNVDFHANKKEVRLIAPELVSDIYGFSHSDFSDLCQKLNLPIAGDLEPFKKFNLEKFLKDQAGDTWDPFVKSLEIEKYDERDLTLGGRTETCTVYRVLWDSTKAQTMAKTVLKNTFSILPDFLVDLVTLLEPDLRCYVDADENLVGLDFTFLGSIYTLLLEGEVNPWESISLKVLSATSEQYYTGGLVSDSAGARIELKANDQTVYAVYYDDSTGAYSIVSPDGEILKGVFQADNSGIYLECNLASKTYLFGIGSLSEEPENMKNKYVDLMDLSIGEVTRLVNELNNSLGITEDLFSWD